MNLSVLITAVDKWDRILNYTYNNSSGLLTLISLVTVVKPFPNKPWILRVCNTSPLKTLREKEKLLISSNLQRVENTYSVFYSFGEKSSIYFSLKSSTADSSSLEKSRISRLGKS